MPRIFPCLWFDTEAEEAAKFYVSIFPNSKIRGTSHYGEEGFEIHGKPAGSVLTVEFELDGKPFTALNGGPNFTFNEAMSLQVMCKDQAEADRYWDALGKGGDPRAQQCGWLKDRYGVSWQIVPDFMEKMFTSGSTEATERVMKVLMPMKKLDFAALEKAYAG